MAACHNGRLINTTNEWHSVSCSHDSIAVQSSWSCTGSSHVTCMCHTGGKCMKQYATCARLVVIAAQHGGHMDASSCSFGAGMLVSLT